MLSASEYRESLRRLNPRVFVDGRAVERIADAPEFQPGINALGVSYDFAREARYRPVATAVERESGRTVNRMLHIDRDGQDLLNKLEAVRLLCRETGCAQRYLAHDGLNALYQATHRIDADLGTEYHPRLLDYLGEAQDRDLALGIAMTDAKGDRALRPHEQTNPDVYVRIAERRADGIVIRGTKAIVTAAPYVHEFLVMPCRNMSAEDSDFAVACAVPIDAPGVTIVAKPAGRPGEAAAKFSGRYGQSTAVVMFEDVFVPWERVFLAGEWQHSWFLTTAYATHHRHSCIAARAGFGDLLIGAGVLMSKSNGLEPERVPHIRNSLVELIKMIEGFYACGVAASVYSLEDPAGNIMPEPVFANIGKLLLATQIYDMQRIAHEVSGGLVVALPGPDEDHNPETRGDLATMLAAHPDFPHAQRIEVARLIQDLTASDTAGWYSIISLHGGGSPEAMRREIYRFYPLEERVQLIERLLDRGVLADRSRATGGARQLGRCCPVGCQVPTIPRPETMPPEALLPKPKRATRVKTAKRAEGAKRGRRN